MTEKGFKIEAEIDEKTGNLSVAIKGVKGVSCMNIIEQFDNIGEVTQDTHHSEFYEMEQEVQRVTNVNRK